MFKGDVDMYHLKCVACVAEFKPTELASARAHENFKPGHRIVVHHDIEGGIGPLFTFSRIKG
jgi:hypothetical protein